MIRMASPMAHFRTSNVTFIPTAVRFPQPMSRTMFSRRIPRRLQACPLHMGVLSDEEKEHILQPSPYQPHRRLMNRAHEPTPTPPTRVNSYANHQELITSIKAIRGDPLEPCGGRIVTYRGNPKARLMIIGEAPGEQEDIQGMPFVGKAGKLLDKIFVYGGFSTEEQLYITNVVKRRPPNNRNPTRAEIEFFLPYVHEEIRLIDPVIIILAGSIAARALLGPHLRITKDRGRWYDVDGRHVMPVLHPSYLLRVEVAKYDMVKDIEAIREKYKAVIPEDPLMEMNKASG